MDKILHTFGSETLLWIYKSML